jgi:hypothetical protein
MRVSRCARSVSRVALVLAGALSAGVTATMLGTCGPFTDVAADAFCPFVLEIFDLGITAGTTATTYDPSGNVTRVQMAAFLSRTVDGVLRRGSRRAALNRFWIFRDPKVLAGGGVGTIPGWPASNGEDLWVPAAGSDNSVMRIHASDVTLLETWTGATAARAASVGPGGRIVVTGNTNPGRLYELTGIPGAVTTVASTVGSFADGIAFDGSRVWVASNGGSVSIITYDFGPWTVTTVTAGFNTPYGALYDGANAWVTDNGAGTLLKLDSNASVLQTVTVGAFPLYPVFDGNAIWVPNNSGSVSVVRASSGVVLATLTGNGLNGPYTAAFDGERILVTNPVGDSVSLWKAADLTPLGSVSVPSGSTPIGACSDGINFWVTLLGSGSIVRF